MNTSRVQTHLLRRARAHFSVVSLLGVLAAGSISPVLRGAQVETKTGTDQGHRQARRNNLKPDQHRPPTPLALFDTDHDGRLSAAEIAAAPAVLRKLDTDGDGQLSGREMMPPRPPGAPGAQGGPPDDRGPPPENP
jgi:hypothetical protein